MKIYVTHSTAFDFKKELYEPIRNSELNKKNQIALPHETSTELFNSKEYMKSCNLIIAEVSYPSTGQGIELGWANLYNVPILAFYKSGSKPSGSIKAVTNTILEYKNTEELISLLERAITSNQ